MTASPPRALLALVFLALVLVTLVLVLVTLVLAGAAGSAGAETTTAQAQQQPLVTKLDLQASLAGEFVVVAGWFDLTASAEGRLDTSSQESDLGRTLDVDLAETFGEFEFRGEVVGTVNASRVLFAFAGNASTFGRGESAASPNTSSLTGGDVGASGDVDVAAAAAAPKLDPGDREHIDPTPVVGPVDRVTRQPSLATLPAIPLQLSPFRRPGISFLDVYWQLATLLLGVVVVGVLPRFSRRVADLGAGDPLRTGGAGLAVVLVVPVALLVLGLSLFGIPLAIAGTALCLVLWWVGAVYGRFTVGLWLLDVVSRALAAVDVDVGRVENRWAGLLVGVGVVGILVLLPIVGPLVESAVLLLGLGGISRLAYRWYLRSERTERTHTVEAVTGVDDDRSGRR